MLTIYKTDDERIHTCSEFSGDCWIHLTAPNAQELSWVINNTNVASDFLHASLDDEERSRIEKEDEQTLIVVDTALLDAPDGDADVTTLPLGIILLENCIITVCLKDTPLMRDFENGIVRSFSTKKRSRFVLQILYRNAARFLHLLRRIDKRSSDFEKELHKTMKNKDLISMLKLEKSLVYISTSLKGNEVVLERLLRMSFIRKYPDDTDLLEDVIIENKQAMEMCTIYRDILSGTMNAFASVISNNLNVFMKALTIITVILTIPTLIASLWGMNVPVPLEGNPYGFWIVLGFSVVLSLVATVYMKIKKMF